MTKIDAFKETMIAGYTCKGEYITVGGAVYEGQPLEKVYVNIPLKTLNRHGLIAGATGTGKTKSLQVMAEHLSKKGVPVLLMDLKGDLSGIGESGEVKPFILERLGKIGLDFQPQAFPTELLTISEQNGVRMRVSRVLKKSTEQYQNRLLVLFCAR